MFTAVAYVSIYMINVLRRTRRYEGGKHCGGRTPDSAGVKPTAIGTVLMGLPTYDRAAPSQETRAACPQRECGKKLSEQHSVCDKGDMHLDTCMCVAPQTVDYRYLQMP